MRKVLNISKHDTIGRRFNNLDARDNILDHGWESSFSCWTKKLSDKDHVYQASSDFDQNLAKVKAKIGRLSGNLVGYHSNAAKFKKLSAYNEADMLHYHIVHEEYLSSKDWVDLSSGKPVVWTWHDPYMFSGHCIYSLGCDGFERGCLKCPNLNYHFPIKRDRSAKNLDDKKRAVEKINPMVVVASDYMKKLVERSVYGDFLRVSVLPFGVDTVEEPNNNVARTALGIPEGNVVVGFRAVYSDYKGMPLIRYALEAFLKKYPSFPITIITFQEKDAFNDLLDRCQVIDAGWVAGSEIYKYYSAMDFFLMPSKAEAFGMMAIEALASGACPVVTIGTALPDIVPPPPYGLCSQHDEVEYSLILEEGILNSERLKSVRGERVSFAKSQFSVNTFCEKLTKIYDEEYERFYSI